MPLLTIFLALGQIQSAFALDEERLWLPRSYQKLYLNLKDAAIAAENLTRCASVLDGTIDLEQSTEAHPIFRILCRQENGRTYSEMVDGLSLETLTTPKEVTPSAEDLEQLRLAEEQRKREEEQALMRRLWELCHQEFITKTRLMINLQGPRFDGVPDPEFFGDEYAIFGFEFDAEDISGGKLEFRAVCEVNDAQVLNLEISRRQEVDTR